MTATDTLQHLIYEKNPAIQYDELSTQVQLFTHEDF
ncbi:hypothetical protein FAM18175_02195 [Lacticaseibacillus paracasei]|nr:hypothetical protein FAM18175_02195 [Lacticaseibacillus paracasei]